MPKTTTANETAITTYRLAEKVQRNINFAFCWVLRGVSLSRPKEQQIQTAPQFVRMAR
jgi:hypothetical protein